MGDVRRLVRCKAMAPSVLNRVGAPGRELSDDGADAAPVFSSAVADLEMRMDEVLLIMTTLPDDASSEAFTRVLLEQRMAACVTRVPTVRSMYWWQGQLERCEECLLLIKSRVQCWDAIEALCRAHHPYDVPELVAFRPQQVGASYLQWLLGEIAHPSNPT